MPATDHKMGEAELLDRLRLVAEAFRPTAPIDRRSLFAGRSEQISDVFSVVAQPGQHAVIYGERGVGKTSLAAVSAQMLVGANVLVARVACDAGDDFGSVWRKVLGEIEMHSTKQAVGFSTDVRETSRSAAGLLGTGAVTPHAVMESLQKLTKQSELAIFVDEFDRLHNADTRVLFADTIKTLSDRIVRATILLIGVADDVGELVREHRSVERALAQIHMPRMSRAELTEIATRGIEAAQMTIAKRAVGRITALSQGLPHYTQLLTQLAAQAALGQRRSDVVVRHVDAAVEHAIERAQQSIVGGYREATAGNGPSAGRDVLLACALADVDEFGFFAAADVRPALTKILGKPARAATVSHHLDAFVGSERGAVLQRQGGGATARYRFANPLFQPYVAMRGVMEGVVTVEDLS